MVGQREYPAENQATLEKTLEKDEKYKTCRYHEEQKRSIHALFFLKKSHLTDLHQHGKQLRPMPRAFLSAVTSGKRELQCTQNCTAPAMPMLLFMRPRNELDHATDLSLKWQATQKKGVFLSQISSPSTQSNRKVNHHNRGGGAEVGTTVRRAASERNTHKNNTLNAVCSKQYKMKKAKLALEKTDFDFFFN